MTKFQLVLITIALWLVYHFTIRLPDIEQKNMMAQWDYEQEQRNSLEGCYNVAQANYINNWNTLCRKLGYGDSCLLSNTQSDNLMQSRTSDRINCEKMFPIR